MSNQENPLVQVAQNEDVDEAQRLLDNGADPDIQDFTGSAPLHEAAKRGNLKMIELLLEFGSNPNIKDSSESTPLHYAAQNEHNEIVQLLLEYWTDPNAKDRDGLTPLHVAAEAGSVVVVKLLLGSGANREIEDDSGDIPVSKVLETHDPELISLLGEPEQPAISWPTGNKPTFPIMINGNELDTSKRKATESLESRYILVQSRVPFSKADITKLEEAGAKYLDYVSENTYLCRYQDGGPKQIPITELDFVVYLGVYGQEFKISPRLKEARDAQPDQEYEVDVIVHKDVDLKSTDVLEDLRNDIIEKAQCGDSDVQFVQNKARLNIKGRHLDDVASIFDVHHIEDVAKLVLYNDVARQILEISGRPPVIPQRYAGKGQVIAITDTGLDGGEHNMTHPAFQGRVRSWRSEHNFTADEDGHGTHVCGSAVGGGSTDTRLIHGTAPQAELVVQSIYNPSTGKLSTPRSLTDLFDDAYAQGARVHSNSWGECEDPFRQLGYTTHAGEIEKFMYEHPDTIMCWAAGNDHHAQAQSGQIGAEAAAKNCITVGASERSSGPNNPKINEIAIFSSRGPTISKFHKPDVVAPGTGILSANSGSAIGDHPKWPGPDKYSCYMSGTSMATPLVAGCAAVLREALENPQGTLHTPNPSAALVKALLINGADILEPITSRFVPSFSSGFGRVNVANAITIVEGAQGTGFYERQFPLNSPANPMLWEENINVGASVTLKVTLVWSDPPFREIRNQLLLIVGGKRSSTVKNNVQQVVLQTPVSGEVKLSVLGTLSAEFPEQKFAVVWRVY